MKKYFILFAFVFLWHTIYAYDFSAVAPSGQTLYYNISGNNVIVYGNNNTSGNLTIPSSVTHYGTTYSVTSIGQYAFYNCSGLTSVTIPNSVTSIDNNAFYNCYGLTSVTIPNSVTSIGQYAFYNCYGLTSVTIPNSVTSISNYAFAYCDGLTSVTIPNSVTSIGYYAFRNCSGLTSVTIPNSVTSIGAGAFSYCSGLTLVQFNANSCGDFTTNPDSYHPFYNCTSLSAFDFGDSVRYIPSNCCYNLPNLTSVTIPNSVTSIGHYAFYNCDGLTSVQFNADSCIGFTTIYPFCNCTSLSAFTFGDSVRYIPSNCCYNLPSLTSVTIPNSVTSIGSGAFSYCSNLLIVYMMPSTPPYLNSNVFTNNAFGRYFIIPCESINNYQAIPANGGYGYWYDYCNYLDVPSVDFVFYVNSDDTTKGDIEITYQYGHTVFCDSTVIINAHSNYGYHFDKWSNDNTNNPDTLHLIGDSVVIAYFSPNRYNIALQSNDNEIGTISGGGTYIYLDTIILSATPIDHHHLVYWMYNNGAQNEFSSDNPLRHIVRSDDTVTAYFAIDTHTVSVATNDIARGMVQSSGNEFAYGKPCTVEAIAYTGYSFVGWSNGVTANPYTFAVLSDVELTALFIAEGEEVYTVTVESANPTMGTVSGGGQAMSGGEVSFRAISYPGYRFLRWNDNNTDSIRTVIVTANVTYTAYFESTTQDINGVMGNEINIYVLDGKIIADDVNKHSIRIFDLKGREVANYNLPSAVYLVKIDNHPARKIVVIR